MTELRKIDNSIWHLGRALSEPTRNYDSEAASVLVEALIRATDLPKFNALMRKEGVLDPIDYLSTFSTRPLSSSVELLSGYFVNSGFGLRAVPEAA